MRLVQNHKPVDERLREEIERVKARLALLDELEEHLRTTREVMIQIGLTHRFG